MASFAPLLLAAAVQASFGAPVEVRVQATPTVHPGQRAGDVVVSSEPRRLPDGGWAVDLRPTALGRTEVPLPGAQPAVLEVEPTLSAADAPAALLAPAPALPLGPALLGAALAVAAILVWSRARRHRVPDPLGELEARLVPLAEPASWDDGAAADRAAAAVRTFLAAVFAGPFAAMTTREIARLLPVEAPPHRAAPFIALLEACDAARFGAPRPDRRDAAAGVRGVLGAAPALLGTERQPE